MLKMFFLIAAAAIALWQPISAQTADTNDIVWKIKNEECYAVEFSPDSKYIASIGTQYVRVFNVEDGSIFKEFPLPESNQNFTDITWSSDGNYLAASGYFGLRLWQTNTWEEIECEKIYGEYWRILPQVHFINNNTQLLVGANISEGALVVYSIPDGKKVKSIRLYPEGVQGVNYSCVNLDISYDNKYILARIFMLTGIKKDVPKYYNFLLDGNTYEILQTKIPTGNHKFFNHSNRALVFGTYGTHNGMLVWDFEKDDIEKSISTVLQPLNTQQPVYTISSEDKIFAISNHFSGSDSFFVYNLEIEKLLKSFSPNKKSGFPKNGLNEIDLSKDGKFIIIGDNSSIVLFKANWNRVSIDSELEASNSIKIIPDPANNNIRVDITVIAPGNYDIEAFNESGLMVTDIFSGTIVAGTSSYLWNTDSLSSGVYFIRLFGNGLNLNKKILVNH